MGTKSCPNAHNVVKAGKWWKIATPEYISYLQVSWTKPTFANLREPRKMAKLRPTPPTTTATITLSPLSWDGHWGWWAALIEMSSIFELSKLVRWSSGGNLGSRAQLSWHLQTIFFHYFLGDRHWLKHNLLSNCHWKYNDSRVISSLNLYPKFQDTVILATPVAPFAQHFQRLFSLPLRWPFFGY